MNSKEYMDNVQLLNSPYCESIDPDLIHGAIGCGTEAGEIQNVIKKAIFYKRPIKKWDLVEEIGDMFWYLGLLCRTLDISFEEVMEMNIKKLRQRYPEKFTMEAEQNRDYKKEQEAVEE